MSSYGSTGSQQGADVAPCCATPTLVAALAASFACCFFFVLVFLCLRFLHLRRTRTPRHSAPQPLQGEGQAQQRPKLGLDAATIALIPSFPYLRESSDSAPAECAVCLGALDERERVRQLPACNHLFHQGCVDVWLMSNASCPVCRAKAEPAAPTRASASVVPVEMWDEETVSSSPAASETTPERLGERPFVPRSGQEADLERQ
ncbi:hypothetical protein CFC21_046598 [Triticum aestivum]|uniref:RING-type E3 ubiquitin transferase n=2 Tax=Triticum aestivum TaxID=4565 RepID=A0A3B6GT86_WHEAT|nr:RING-H2 finger protein ATL39-like [Triticum aestivum]KAF7035804.1 hypothetical protein CFC21_046598 [Triticum aestivum]